jgi:NAD(P)-dependent dehydrogenase (short-subunit alcohol dehydrogenase family)
VSGPAAVASALAAAEARLGPPDILVNNAGMTEAQIDYMLSKIPMGRLVLVEEIAALVAWLACEECSFSTGGVFDISGGRATY